MTRFIFQYQGHIQDDQPVLNPNRINNMGILVYNTFSGPFKLEIDYIAFVNDTQHNDTIEYESYFVPEAPYRIMP